MGNEASSSKRRQYGSVSLDHRGKSGNGTRPASSSAADGSDSGGGFKLSKGFSFRRRAKSDAALNKAPLEQPPARAPPPPEDDVNVIIRVYRSTSSLQDNKRSTTIESLHDKMPEYKIHRRSDVDVSALQPTTVGSTQSLPRPLSRRHRPRSTLSVANRGGDSEDGRGQGGSSGVDYPELRPRHRSTAGSEPNSPKTNQGFSRLSSLPKKVSLLMSDFPSTQETVRKLKLFEMNFTQALMSRYERLEPVQRLSILLLAMRYDKAIELLSLWDYAISDIEPDAFGKSLDGGRFFSLVPEVLLAQIMLVKKESQKAKVSKATGGVGEAAAAAVMPDNYELWLSLAHDIVVSIAEEVSGEVARVYEYQIVLLGEDASSALVAEHAAECSLNYVLERGFPLDRNTAVQGVVYGRAEYHAATPTMFSVVIGENELKWELHDLFQKPGLRKDAALTRSTGGGGGGGAEFRFFASKQSDAQLYGYRGQIIDWDMGKSTYKVNKAEEEQFAAEETGGDNYHADDNFHRFYRPFRRLVGYEMMAQYCSDVLLNRAASLRQYLLGPHDEAAERDDVQPVYRPLTKDKKNPLTFHRARLDWSDMTRARFPKTDWEQISVRGVILTHCELGPAAINVADWSRFEAADLSYSKIVVRTAPSERVLLRLRAVYAAFEVTADASVTEMLVTDDKGTLVTVNQAMEEKKAQLAAAEAAIQASASAAMTSSAPSKKSATGVKKRNTIGASDVNASRASAQPVAASSDNERVKKRNTMTAARPTDAMMTSSSAAADTAPQAPVRKKVKDKSSKDSQSPRHPKSHHTAGDGRPASMSISTTSTASEEAASLTSSTNSGRSAVHKLPSEVRVTPTKSPGVFSDVISTFMSSPQIDLASTSTSSVSRHQAASVTNLPMSSTPTSRTEPPPLTSSQSSISPKRAPQRPLTVSLAPASEAGRVSQRPPVEGVRSPSTYLSVDNVRQSRPTGSQVALGQKALAGIEVTPLAPLLPDDIPKLVGRSTDIERLCHALTTSQRLVALIGPAGIGKSAIGQTAARLLQRRHQTPLHVDVQGALTTDGIFRRMMLAFGLRFQIFEVPLFVTWLACRPQNLLLVLDNVDVTTDNDATLSILLDELLVGVPRLRVLVTSRRRFYSGGTLACRWQLLRPMTEADTCRLVSDLTPKSVAFKPVSNDNENRVDDDAADNTEFDPSNENSSELSSPNIKNNDKADDNIDTGDTVSSFEDTTDDSSKITKRNNDGEIVKVDDEGENEVDMDAIKIAENNEESVTVPQNNENEAEEHDNDNMEDIDTTPLDINRLTEQNIKDIARLCQGNAAICKIIMLSLKQPDIKARLLPVLLVDESASNNNNNNNNNNSENNNLSEDTANGDAVDDRKVDESAVTSSKPSPEQNKKALRSLMLAVDSLQPMHKQVLTVAATFSTSFSCSELQALLPEPETTVTSADEASEDGEEKIVTIETALADLRKLGYVTGRETRRGTRYCLQTIVRTTLLNHQAKQPQQQSATFENELANAYVALFVGKLTDLKERFFSRDSISAFVDFSEDMDSMNDFLLDISSRDSVYDVLRQSASLLYVVFLTTLLPEITYVRLYSRLAEVAERQEDVTTQAAALSCMAWYQLVNQQYVEARKNLEMAMDAQLGSSYGGQRRTLTSATVKAFCQLCQARLLWIEQQEKAIDLAREAVEDLQTTLGRTDITTLIASEIYDMMLIDRSSSVNLSVTGEMSEYPLETALGAHPLLLRSYGSRRLLWDKFCLFQRACDMANKAVDIARLFYAEHPLTADALVLLSSSYVKLGAIPQALDAAIAALAIRQRTLGSHDKTAAAYAMIARILRRACLYEDAVVFAKHALDLYNELDGGGGNSDGTGSSSSTSGSVIEAAKADVRNIIIQCLAKQQRRQANAVRGPASNRQSALSPTTPGSTPSSGIVSPSSPLNPPFGNLGLTLASSTAGKPGPGFRVNGNLQRAADSPDGHAPTSPTVLSRSQVVAREGFVTREASTPNAASGVPVRPSSRTGITAHEMSMSRSQDLSKQQQQLSSRTQDMAKLQNSSRTNDLTKQMLKSRADIIPQERPADVVMREKVPSSHSKSSAKYASMSRVDVIAREGSGVNPPDPGTRDSAFSKYSSMGPMSVLPKERSTSKPEVNAAEGTVGRVDIRMEERPQLRNTSAASKYSSMSRVDVIAKEGSVSRVDPVIYERPTGRNAVVPKTNVANGGEVGVKDGAWSLSDVIAREKSAQRPARDIAPDSRPASRTEAITSEPSISRDNVIAMEGSFNRSSVTAAESQPEVTMAAKEGAVNRAKSLSRADVIAKEGAAMFGRAKSPSRSQAADDDDVVKNKDKPIIIPAAAATAVENTAASTSQSLERELLALNKPKVVSTRERLSRHSRPASQHMPAAEVTANDQQHSRNYGPESNVVIDGSIGRVKSLTRADVIAREGGTTTNQAKSPTHDKDTTFTNPAPQKVVLSDHTMQPIGRPNEKPGVSRVTSLSRAEVLAKEGETTSRAKSPTRAEDVLHKDPSASQATVPLNQRQSNEKASVSRVTSLSRADVIAKEALFVNQTKELSSHADNEVQVKLEKKMPNQHSALDKEESVDLDDAVPTEETSSVQSAPPVTLADVMAKQSPAAHPSVTGENLSTKEQSVPLTSVSNTDNSDDTACDRPVSRADTERSTSTSTGTSSRRDGSESRPSSSLEFAPEERSVLSRGDVIAKEGSIVNSRSDASAREDFATWQPNLKVKDPGRTEQGAVSDKPITRPGGVTKHSSTSRADVIAKEGSTTNNKSEIIVRQTTRADDPLPKREPLILSRADVIAMEGSTNRLDAVVRKENGDEAAVVKERINRVTNSTSSGAVNRAKSMSRADVIAREAGLGLVPNRTETTSNEKLANPNRASGPMGKVDVMSSADRVGLVDRAANPTSVGRAKSLSRADVIAREGLSLSRANDNDDALTAKHIRPDEAVPSKIFSNNRASGSAKQVDAIGTSITTSSSRPMEYGRTGNNGTAVSSSVTRAKSLSRADVMAMEGSSQQQQQQQQRAFADGVSSHSRPMSQGQLQGQGSKVEDKRTFVLSRAEVIAMEAKRAAAKTEAAANAPGVKLESSV